MFGKVSSIILICCASFISCQQQTIKPLPRPFVNIQCGRHSALRTTGLIPTANQQLPTTCTYTIHAASFFVCQLRLDFVRFSLPQPTVDTTTPGNAYPACNNGYLQVGDIKLCGENAGQHIYVPINPRNINERQMKITIVTNGNGMSGLSDWQITVNQLDCPLGQSRKVQFAIDQQNSMNFTQEKPIRTPRGLVSDFLAPRGCLQYYPETEGRIDSFNFNDGKGPYIGDMNYAICFRRERNNKAIQLTRTFFQMGITNDSPDIDGINEQCFETENGITSGRSEDYIFIPAAIVDLPPLKDDDPSNPTTTIQPPNNSIRRVRATRFCGSSLTRALGVLESSPPGPFQIIFNSDREYYPNLEIGFRFQYKIV